MKVLADRGNPTNTYSIQLQASNAIVPGGLDPSYVYFYGNNSINIDVTASNIKIWNVTQGLWSYGGDSKASVINVTINDIPSTPIDGLYQYTVYFNEFFDANDGDNLLVTMEVPNKIARYAIATNTVKSFTEWKDAAIIYSTRLVDTNYTGPLIKVRRSSDDATLDIYPVIQLHKQESTIDETALLAFVGAGSGFIDTWYDQSGNGRNATQATTTNQPRIVNSGVIDRINTRPTVVFDGVSDNLSLSERTFGRNVGYLGAYSVVKWTAVPTAAQNIIYMPTGTNVAVARFQIASSAASKFRLSIRRMDLDGTSTLDTTSNITTSPALYFAYSAYSVPQQRIDINGSQNVVATNSTAGLTENTTPSQIRIGSTAAGTAQYFNGSMSEFIIFNTSFPSTKIANAEASVKAFYGIA
jgi:hypothetical protein